MKKVFISRNYKTTDSAGGKAKTDVENSIQELGYVNIGLKRTFHSNKLTDYIRNLIGTLKAAIVMPRGGVLFLQYPMKKYYKFTCKAAHCRNCKVITLVHDLGTFRRKKLTIEKEIKRLNHSDYIISLNDSMSIWLKENGYNGKCGPMEIWDFLSKNENPSVSPENSKEGYTVNYAGGLSRRKNAFLYELTPYVNSYSFHLFGSGFESETTSDRLVYEGFQNSEDLISSMDGSFGLVWDGDSLDTCSGSFGSYLQYNTPHKISLYVRCHLPILIWKGAAMSDFIEREKIGLSIHSLKELDSKLTSITVGEYETMKQNTVIMSGLLASGHYIKTAVSKAEKELFNQ